MPTTDRTERIAIVGVGGIFPGALDLDSFWRNVSNGVDSGRNVPDGRWFLDPSKALDPDGPKPDRVYSTWGCFIEGFQFDPTGLNLDPGLLRQLDPLFHLGLHAARAAYLDADGISGTNPGRVGVILGNIVLPTESTSAKCRELLGRTFIEKLLESTPLTPAQQAEMKSDLQRHSQQKDWHPLNRLAASLPAKMIAEGLGFGGVAYTLDAACASSLYALKFACDELRAHRADAMLAGGMSRPDCQYTQMGFAQLKALSKRGCCVPLSAAADGLVVGEGAGIFVLKRLSDAITSGDHIYGIIAGIGLSNDRGANLLAPHSEGQLRAMRLAYEEAGWQPNDVDLIECHATGTPVGDGVEIDSLHQLWQDQASRPGQCVIGGVKSNVGHLLTGAGAAGLMKVLYALKHQTLPPTANYKTPAAGLAKSDSPFRVLSQAEPWQRRSVSGSARPSDLIPYRATINAFGFGGINAHVLIEEYIPQQSYPGELYASDSSPRPCGERLGEGSSTLFDRPLPNSIAHDHLAPPTTREQQPDSEPIVRRERKAPSPQPLSPQGRGEGLDIAIVGMGLQQAEWDRCDGKTGVHFHPITSVRLPLGKFRIPPLEMQDMLPQQQLMLQVTAEAIKDAECGDGEDGNPTASTSLGNRTGVFIGIELDPNTTNFHFRWSIEEQAAAWAASLGVTLSATEMDEWVTQLKDAVGPPLTANRVMGNLGGIVASRLAREFHVGGPSFTISSAEHSGLHAVELAAHALRRGELDQAVVGAVDLPCDVRNRQAISDQLPAGSARSVVDGAVAFVLKRREDAVRDGDRIHAVISSISSTCSDESETTGDTAAVLPESEIFAGAATGLLKIAAAVGSLQHRIIQGTSLRGSSILNPRVPLAVSSNRLSSDGEETDRSEPLSMTLSPNAQTGQPARYWLHNRCDGSRRIRVKATERDGRFVLFDLIETSGDQFECLTQGGVEDNSQEEETPHPASPRKAGERSQTRPTSPTGLGVGLFVVDGDSIDELAHGLQQLAERIDLSTSVNQFAKSWFHKRPPRNDRRLAVTLVIKSMDEMADVIRAASARLRDESTNDNFDRRFHFTRDPLGHSGRLAFVFPGSGNAFVGMGRELLSAFPDVLNRQQSENERLKDQYRPDLAWYGESTAKLLENHKAMIFSQVALGTGVCDLLAQFNIRPSASIGYSLGESAALFGLRAWTDRDEMLQRMDRAALFGSDLVHPFNAARRAWRIPDQTDVPWVSGIVDCAADMVRETIARSRQSNPSLRVYLLIVNTPRQCVIGGDRLAVEELVKALAATFVPFAAPSTVHCEILHEVEAAYRELHLMPTSIPLHGNQPIDFYSTAWGRPYHLTRESAAEAIVAQAVATIDFPHVIERAYQDGVRLFVEVGPGSSCTRMIDDILGDKPHVARAATPATANPVAAFMELLAVLISHRAPVDLEYLYGSEMPGRQTASDTGSQRELTTVVGSRPYSIPVPPDGWKLRPPQRPVASVSRAVDVSLDAVANKKPAIVPIDLHPPRSTELNAGASVGLKDGKPTEEKTPHPASTRTVAATGQLSTTRQGDFDTTKFQDASAGTNVMTHLDELLAARAKAHEAYLRVSAEAQRIMAEQLERLARIANGNHSPLPASLDEVDNLPAPLTEPRFSNEVDQREEKTPHPASPRKAGARSQTSTITHSDWERPSTPPRSLSREQCMEFAIGQIGRVLGETFAGIDQYPTRVRLPDEPLMLVDRILEIDGEPLSMTSGRVVTEHDIHRGAWYLDCDRIPTCIAVEAGQADLFLSGWLGIDFETKGLACYRLLDAVVTFHRGLPGPGKTIHYDIKINHFFRQGQTYLFRFEFDATVDGEPLLTMREGCAGFFTDAELAGGKGIVHTALDRQPRPGKRPADWRDMVPMTIESYDDSQLLALREGNLAACFGDAFARLQLKSPVTLPGLISDESDSTNRSRMWLVDRILKLDPHGGKYSLGTILGELDIHPDDWFITCHFCDDQVMPGTLMYECCMHTLRIYLLRMGWIGEAGQVAYQPIPGIRSRLKCRGQVLATTKKVWYEITIKELGYTDSSVSDAAASTPYCLADALMYADGKPIVEITDMSVRLTGLTFDAVSHLWNRSREQQSNSEPVMRRELKDPSPQFFSPQGRGEGLYDRRPALFDTDRITAFAIGKPSEAFGDRYRIFDSERTIARLPGPPFQFLDRIVAISGCQPWVLQPGGEVVAQYDVPHDAWYFASNRQKTMPFAVLLETALQPCGWLAAYVGSALTSETDISFRNLGGTATQFREVTAESGTLTTTVKMTRVSNSGGMIIQHYDFDLRCDNEPVYVGNTYFGFFSKASLEHQVGIRDAKPFAPSPAEASRAHRLGYVDAPPFADSHFQMIDDVTVSLEDGPFGHGFVVGTTDVDPSSWFFKAHFYQDPVVPGSLGLESFFQLLKIYAAYRWQLTEDAQFATPMIQSSASQKHEWVYRGQVVPKDSRVTVSAVIKEVNDATKELTAEGFLSVDGRIIYQMKQFSLSVNP